METKHWFEIFGGIICVVLIIAMGSAVVTGASATIEDAAAVNAFQSFTQTMVKATQSTTQTVSPWSLSTSRDYFAYAIVYVTGDLVSILENRGDLDSSSKTQLDSCKGDANDACLCLLGIQYMRYETCGNMPFNLIALTPSFPPDYHAERKSIEGWNQEFPEGTMNSINVLSCTSVKSLCSWADSSGNNPCLLYYEGRPIVWLSAKSDKKLAFETLIMNKDPSNYFIDIVPNPNSGICTSKCCLPCYDCSNSVCKKAPFNCASDYTSTYCSYGSFCI
jgi:hypothetical protein